MAELLSQVTGEGPQPGETLDAGAEEELFRRVGQQAAGRALARRWEQADQSQASCRQCGGRLQGLGRRERTLQTVCGPVVVRRRVGYCRPCQRTQASLDRQLGIEETGMTPGLMRLVCRTVLELPYQQSGELLQDTLGFAPCSAREMERIAQRHGTRMERAHQEIPALVRPERKSKPVYAVAIDGTMIPGLPDHEQHRLNWHEVKLATVFDPRRLEAPLYIAGRDQVENFADRLWKALQSQDLDGDSLRVILGDGAPWIWNLADTLFPGVPQLLDFYHAAEHLHATAEALWEGPLAQRWWRRRMGQLQQGELKKFFASLKGLAQHRKATDPEVGPPRLLQYFTDNRPRLRYRWALEQNLPIGSGMVESAARHIVQQRLKQSGMRWSDPGAQAVLNLRTCHRNGHFEQYWENYAA